MVEVMEDKMWSVYYKRKGVEHHTKRERIKGPSQQITVKGVDICNDIRNWISKGYQFWA